MKLRLLAAAALALASFSAPTLAVDNTISSLCRADHAGSGYQRPGGFCDHVAAYGSQGLGSSGVVCPSGTEYDYSVGACVPEV